MITAILTVTSKNKVVSDAVTGYEATAHLLEALHASLPALAPAQSGWFGGVFTPEDKALAFSERTEFLHRLERMMKSEEGSLFSMYLSTARSGRRKPNQLEINYLPGNGVLRIDIYRPTDSALIASLLSALPAAMTVEYAFVNVWDNDPDPEEPGDKTSYRASFATFPHRQCLGWMAYVPHVVTMEQLPLAARIIPAEGGSIIVAVDEPFDLANKDHIKRANQIEMDMSDLGLLPVIDPSF